MKRALLVVLGLALGLGEPTDFTVAQARKRAVRRARRPKARAPRRPRRTTRRRPARRGRRPVARRGKRRPRLKLSFKGLRRVRHRRRTKRMSAAQRQRLRDAAKRRHAQRRSLVKKRREMRKGWTARQMFKRGSDGPSEAGRGLRATLEPVRFFELRKPYRLLAAVRKPREGGKRRLRLEDSSWMRRRKEQFLRTAKTAIPHENLKALPTKFCVAPGRCFGSYEEVRDALYAPRVSGKTKIHLYSPPIFCAPTMTSGQWSADSVVCSTDWRKTAQPADGEYPPFACIGHPHFASQLIETPAEGEVNGFVCRERIFRVYDYPPIQSAEGKKRAIAGMCKDMRSQVWGKDIAETFTSSTGIPASEVTIPPKLPLTREEILYFFGNREFYCRADRQGLVHRSRNAESKFQGKTGVVIGSLENWAQSMTCGVPRGVVEAGPFEEGVQLCAVSPYAHDLVYTMTGKGSSRNMARDLRKARMHCWKFNRPTCEELAFQDAMNKQQKIDSLYKSDVFDFFDAFRELRRTGKLKVLRLKDLKEAEKVPDIAEDYAFTDVANDEGTFGINEFCRFAGDPKKVVCGYNRTSIARYYEVHQNEGGKASGCGDGVCDRGAFERGYYCAIFSMQDYFQGKPVWVCGADQEGRAGRQIVAKARMVCNGGRYATAFVSPKGQRSTLQCYERKFVWASSPQTQKLARLGILQALKKVAQQVKDEGKEIYVEFYTSKAQAQSAKESRVRRGAQSTLVDNAKTIGDMIKNLREYAKRWPGHWIFANSKDKSARDAYRRTKDTLAKAIRGVDRKWRRVKSIGNKLVGVLRRHKQMVKDVMSLGTSLERAIRSAKSRARTDERRGRRTSVVRTRRAKGHAGRRMSQQVSAAMAQISRGLKGRPLGFLGHRASARNHFAGPAKPAWLSDLESWARRRAKSKKQSRERDVAEKIMEVVSRETAAHNRWIQELLLSAKDEKKGYEGIPHDILVKAIQQNMLTRMLDGLRKLTLQRGREYAQAVYLEANRRIRAHEVLTRVELQEKAKSKEIFCVEPKSNRSLRGIFVCSRSPLLVAGELESYADRVNQLATWKRFLSRGRFARALRALRRRGKTKGRRVARKGRRPTRRTARRRVTRKGRRPARRSARRRVTRKRRRPSRKPTRRRVARKGRRPTRKAPRRRVSTARRRRAWGLRSWMGRMRRWRRQRAVDDAKEKIRKNFQTRWCYYVQSPTWAKEVSPALSTGYDSPYEVQVPKKAVERGSVGFLWLRCQSFKYIDEIWQAADRKRWAELHKFDKGEPVKEEKEKVAKASGGVNDPRAKKETKSITQKVGGFVMSMLSMVMPALGKLGKLVKNIGHLGPGFVGQFADKIKTLLENGPWKEALAGLGKIKKAIETARDAVKKVMGKVGEAKEFVLDKLNAFHAAELAYATAPAPVKKSMEKAKKKAKAALKAARDAVKQVKKKLQDAQKQVAKSQAGGDKDIGKMRKKMSEISAGAILVMMLDKITEMISGRVAEAIKPRAASLLKPVFQWVRGVLNPIATAVIQALAAIPFTFGALGYIGQIVYTWALDKLEELAVNGIVGLVERFLSKGVRALLSPLMNLVKPMLAKVVRSMCSAIPQLAKVGLCVQERFAALPPKYRWVDRALACKYNAPRITPRMHREAVAARFEIKRQAEGMKEDVIAYVRGIANPIFARFGYTYDTWMAAFRPGAPAEQRATAALVAPALVEHVQDVIGTYSNSTNVTSSPYWPDVPLGRAVAERLEGLREVLK